MQRYGRDLHISMFTTAKTKRTMRKRRERGGEGNGKGMGMGRGSGRGEERMSRYDPHIQR